MYMYICNCLVPEEVQDLVVDILTSISVLVHWREPAVPNGVITSYEVYVTIVGLKETVSITEVEKLETNIDLSQCTIQ